MSNVKKVITNSNWIITKVIQGRDGVVRIDAKKRFHETDKSDFFSKWVSYRYANKIYKNLYGEDLPITY